MKNSLLIIIWAFQRYVRQNVQSHQMHEEIPVFLMYSVLSLEDLGCFKEKTIYTVQSYSKIPLFNNGYSSSCKRIVGFWVVTG